MSDAELSHLAEDDWAVNLGSCLRHAGTLCAAWEEGAYGNQVELKTIAGVYVNEWSPGCGKEMPCF